MGLILKLDMLTSNYLNGIDLIQLFLVETVCDIEAVLAKNEQKWPFLGIFGQNRLQTDQCFFKIQVDTNNTTSSNQSQHIKL